MRRLGTEAGCAGASSGSESDPGAIVQTIERRTHKQSGKDKRGLRTQITAWPLCLVPPLLHQNAEVTEFTTGSVSPGTDLELRALLPSRWQRDLPAPRQLPRSTSRCVHPAPSARLTGLEPVWLPHRPGTHKRKGTPAQQREGAPTDALAVHKPSDSKHLEESAPKLLTHEVFTAGFFREKTNSHRLGPSYDGDALSVAKGKPSRARLAARSRLAGPALRCRTEVIELHTLTLAYAAAEALWYGGAITPRSSQHSITPNQSALRTRLFTKAMPPQASASIRHKSLSFGQSIEYSFNTISTPDQYGSVALQRSWRLARGANLACHAHSPPRRIGATAPCIARPGGSAHCWQGNALCQQPVKQTKLWLAQSPMCTISLDHSFHSLAASAKGSTFLSSQPQTLCP